MKKLFFPLVIIICMSGINKLSAQTGLAINTDGSAADGSAMLDVKSTGKGVLVPRMTLALRPATPATGLLIYQTDATPGFYYYNGSAWIYIQNSGNTNITTQGNTFNGASQLVQLNGSSQLPAVSGVNVTALNASNLASGTVPTVRLGSGTANSTTFLRGDNTWAAPAGGGTGQTFAINAAMPGNTSQNWIGLNSGALSTFGANHRAIVMPVAGTFDAIYLSCTISSVAASSTVTVTLYKNGVATTLQAVVIVTTLGATVTASDLAHPISVIAGDLISIGIVQTNSTPVIQFGVSTHFQ